MSSSRLLYITHRVPYPPDKGDRIRTFNMLRHLARNHHIHLACLADEPVPQETRQVLSDLCEQVAIVPIQPNLRKIRMAWSMIIGGTASVAAFRSKELSATLQSWAKKIDFDIALASASSITPYLDVPGLKSVPALVDLVDVDSEKWFNYSSATSFPKSWIYRREGTMLRKHEQQLSNQAKAVLLVSEAESQLFRGIAPAAPIHTVTNGVDLEYFQPMHEQEVEHQCAFVGALDYHPNIDAVCWFASEVWPAIREKYPDAIFQIVGRRPVPVVQALNQIPGIEVIGQVPDVRPFVSRASVVIAPLRIARGLQNKVLEALAMAKPVIASPAALAGLHPDASSPTVQVNTGPEWVTALDHLFNDSERRQALGRQGRAYVETHYHWDRCLEPLQHLIESILEAKASTQKLSSPSLVAV